MRSPESHNLSCMEIWGGSEQVTAAVSIPGVDAWIYGQPYHGSESGGDVYYASSCAAGVIGRFVLADVAGHGAAASATAKALRDMMRKNINTLDQTRFARSLNDLFLDHNSENGTFATALLTAYHSPSKHLLVCNAGHPCPLLFRARKRLWQRLEPSRELSGITTAGLGNLPLGIISPTTFEQFAILLEPGDLVVMYTDALIEAGPNPTQMLGEAGLLNLIANLRFDSAQDLGEAIIEAVDSLAQSPGPANRTDDMTLMILHHNAAPPPHRSLKDLTKIAAKLLGLASV